jgi:hypothetical protein
MTFNERNEHIQDAMTRLKMLHDIYTSSTRLLSDEQWNKYIDSMDAVTAEYKNTNMYDTINRISQALLDDTEMVFKKLKEIT